MRDDKFKIKAYGKSELAMLYFPHMSQEGARKALRHWLEVNPRLRKLKKNKNKYFTPREVKKIVDEVGEPFDTEDLNSL